MKLVSNHSCYILSLFKEQRILLASTELPSGSWSNLICRPLSSLDCKETAYHDSLEPIAKTSWKSCSSLGKAISLQSYLCERKTNCISTRLLTSARVVGVKTAIAVCLSEIEQKTCLSQLINLWGCKQKAEQSSTRFVHGKSILNGEC